MPTGNVDLLRSAAVTLQVQSHALASARSERVSQMQEQARQKFTLTAEEIGKVGRRSTVDYQRSRGPQDRFLDMFA